MDYSRHLVLYSGGVDSTYFIEKEQSAKYLIHYTSQNSLLTKVAFSNANILNRFITIVEKTDVPSRDGEINQIHALYDTQMALDASIRALSHGMQGIVMCFNSDDIGIHFSSIESIVKRAEPKFSILLPLKDTSSEDIRVSMKSSKLKTISCMNSESCGYCAKCIRGH